MRIRSCQSIAIKNCIYTLSLSILLLDASSKASAQPVADLMDSMFTWEAEHQLLMGNILVAEQGRVVYKKSFGYQDIENSVLNTDSSAFALASVSKIMTATAILQLKEKKKLGLDDPFSRYFNGFPYADITIRQMLTHTSGLPDYEELFDSLAKAHPQKVFTNADMIPGLKVWNKPLLFKPGEGWRYSSVSYCLLALLIEKLSKLPFEKYLARHIFQPAGMRQTYLENYLLTRKNKYRTVNYMYKPKEFSRQLRDVNTIPSEHRMIYNYGGLMGQGGLTSTTSDLLLFDRAFFSGQLIAKQSIDEALTPALLNNGKKAISMSFPGIGKSYYGLGWFIAEDTLFGKLVYHQGGRPGVQTMYIHNLSKDQTIIVLENALFDVSSSAASALRMLNHAQPLKQKMSISAVYSRTLFEKGPDAAAATLNYLKADTGQYKLEHWPWIMMGFEFYDAELFEKSVEAFKIGTLLFPDNWLISQGYADALVKTGKREEAVLMYKRSLQHHPGNERALESLKKLESDTSVRKVLPLN